MSFTDYLVINDTARKTLIGRGYDDFSEIHLTNFCRMIVARKNFATSIRTHCPITE